MAKHIVQCRLCKQKFDAQPEGKDKEWVMPSQKQYYHKECYETWCDKRKVRDVTEKVPDKEYLERIKSYLACDWKFPVDWKRFNKDIENLTSPKYNKTLKGIYFSLIYWYDIMGNKWNPLYPGVWSAYLCYEDSKKYWIERAKLQKDVLSKVEQQIETFGKLQKVKVKRKKPLKQKSMISEVDNDYE